jgi:hypothetical protein
MVYGVLSAMVITNACLNKDNEYHTHQLCNVKECQCFCHVIKERARQTVNDFLLMVTNPDVSKGLQYVELLPEHLVVFYFNVIKNELIRQGYSLELDVKK